MRETELNWITILDAQRLEREREKTNSAAFRIDTAALIFVTSGAGTVTINLQRYAVTKNNVVTIIHHSLIEINDWSDDFRAFYIHLPADFTQDLDLWKNAMKSLSTIVENPVLDIANAEHISFINSYCSMLHEICSKQDITYRKEIVKNMLEAIMFAVGGLYQDFSEQQGGQSQEGSRLSRGHNIYKRFLNLVSQNYDTHREVAFYADELCITPKHLGYVIKSISGETPSDVIVEAVMMDAKSKLKSTDMSIGQIADSLNFPNPSFFCKYFRKNSGISPKQYRNNSQKA